MEQLRKGKDCPLQQRLVSRVGPLSWTYTGKVSTPCGRGYAGSMPASGPQPLETRMERALSIGIFIHLLSTQQTFVFQPLCQGLGL